MYKSKSIVVVAKKNEGWFCKIILVIVYDLWDWKRNLVAADTVKAFLIRYITT